MSLSTAGVVASIHECAPGCTVSQCLAVTFEVAQDIAESVSDRGYATLSLLSQKSPLDCNLSILLWHGDTAEIRLALL